MAETDTAEIQYIDGVKTLVPLGTISTISAVSGVTNSQMSPVLASLASDVRPANHGEQG